MTMKPTSQQQFKATAKRNIPPPEYRLDGSLVSIAMPTNVSHIPYSLMYVLVDDADKLHIIDPATQSPENWKILDQVLRQLHKTYRDISTVLITHLHRDHMGMSDGIRERSGARVHMLEQEHHDITAQHPHAITHFETWHVPRNRRAEIVQSLQPRDSLIVDEYLLPGQELNFPGWTLLTMQTPGHTAGHMCFVEKSRRLIFAGDHILPNLNPGIGLGGFSPENPIAEYLAALAELEEYASFEVLPGHGFSFTGMQHRIADIRSHIFSRADEIQQIIHRTGDASIWDIAAQVHWTAGWDNLRGFFLQSALYQTSLYVDFLKQQ